MKKLLLIINLVLFSVNLSASEVHFSTKDNATIYAHIQKRGSHAVLSWPRRGTIPLGAKAMVYWNKGSGEIDYNNPLVTKAIWSSIVEKWGWGLDSFGKGDFGYSGTGAVGWGRGSFGKGEFGFDAEMVIFESESLPSGQYKFAVRMMDAQGNLDEGEFSTWECDIDPLPVAPGLQIESYDELSDILTLNIS